MISRRPFRCAPFLPVLTLAICLAPTVPLHSAGATSEAREIAPGQSHDYSIVLSAGDLLWVDVAQLDVNVVVSCSDPDGHEMIAVDASDDNVFPETLAEIAPLAGTYTVTVRPAASARAGGRYAIRIVPPHQATPEDTRRVAGERAFVAGVRLLDRTRAAGWPQARDQFHAALDAFHTAADPAGEMKAFFGLARAEYYLDDPGSLESAQHSEQLSRTLGDRIVTARLLKLIGNIDVYRGDFPGALRAFDEAIEISRGLGQRNAEARSLNDEALVYNRLGDAESAIAAYERALPLARQTNDAGMEANILNNLGIAYTKLGEDDRARAAYEQSLANRRAARDPRGQMIALGNLGNLDLSAGRRAMALERHTQALAFALEIGSPEEIARVRSTRGVTLTEMGRAAEALDELRASLAVREKIADVSGEAMSLEGIGLALQQLHQFDEARQALERALDIRHRLREEYREVDTLRDIAVLEHARGRDDRAIAEARKAVTLGDALRGRITSPELRASYGASGQSQYELLIDLLENRGDAASIAEALHVSERARARVLLDSVFESRVDLRAGIPPALLDRERALQKALADASTELSGLLAGHGPAAKTAAAAAQVDRLSADYQALQIEIRRTSPQYAALTQPEPLTAAEIQRRVVDDRSVLLEFALGDTRSWLWAVTPGSITSVELPARKTIDAAARQLHASVVARSADAPARAAEMSALLFSGVANALRGEWAGKRLAIVASGPLEYVPFAALPLPGASRRSSLVAAHELVIVPSASVLAARREHPAPVAATSSILAVVADPVFDPHDLRVSVSAPGRDSASSARAGTALPRLAFSRAEADAIAAYVPTARVFKATGFEANRAMVLSGKLAGYRFVHLATHGVVDSDRPGMSALILSLVDRAGRPQDGYLRQRDIYNLRLDADLVVLSACSTALGKEVRGEGLVGLTRAFMYAGTPRVVASLWEVGDRATAQFMKTFYRGLLREQLRPAAALRAAQLEMSRDPRWSAPYYWAAFVIHGDWQ